MTRITGISHEDLRTFTMLTRRSFLRMRNISDKSCTENENTFYVQQPFPPENRAVYETGLMSKRVARGAADNMAHAHVSAQKCVILIAFPQQQ